MCPICLDYNVTTPIDPAAFAAMEPFLREYLGVSARFITGEQSALGHGLVFAL